MKKLSPDYAVVCNSEKRIYPDVRYKLRHIAGAEILPTVDCNGVIADFSGGEIKIKTNIM